MAPTPKRTPARPTASPIADLNARQTASPIADLNALPAGSPSSSPISKNRLAYSSAESSGEKRDGIEHASPIKEARSPVKKSSRRQSSLPVSRRHVINTSFNQPKPNDYHPCRSPILSLSFESTPLLQLSPTLSKVSHDTINKGRNDTSG